METLGAFARRNQQKRAGLPAVVQIGKDVRCGIGLGWILDDPSLADFRITRVVHGLRATTVHVKEAAS